MTIQSAALFRRFARTECLVLVVMVCLCVAAAAQTLPTVMSGSVAGVNHDQWGQIYRIRVAKTGDVLFLDNEKGALYQMQPDGNIVTVSAPGVTLKSGGSMWHPGMALDKDDTLYISDRYLGVHFFKIPYDPVSKSWPFSLANAWGGDIKLDGKSLNTFDIDFDPNGNLIVSLEVPSEIHRVVLDPQTRAFIRLEPVITGLKFRAVKVHADRFGNIFFQEDPWDDATKIVPGVFMIPAGSAAISGDGNGSAEAKCIRIDPNLSDWKGIASDADGNIYISDQNDSFGGGSGTVFMIPRENGVLNKDHAIAIAPVPATAAIAFDPRGFIWIPTVTGGWAPSGSLAIAGTNNFVKWYPGSANAGAAAVGAQGGGGTSFFVFNQDTVLGDVKISQPGSGSDFVQLATNPHPDPEATSPAAPCTPGKTYQKFARCPVWLQLNSRVVGGVSGELALTDAAHNVLSGSSTSIHGIGQGAGLAVLGPAAAAPVGAAFTLPREVAADEAGNIYVADSAAGQVRKFPGAIVIGAGLTAPTGVAVDGAGNVYIGDSGKLIRVSPDAAQTVLQSGLGANLNLAVDGAGTVYVADPDHAHVVMVPNAATRLVMPQVTFTAGSGFSQPTAVAVDATGNLFVADAGNLIKIAIIGGQTTITSALGAASGLAVDASGSVYAAQAGGLIRIPVLDGALSFNDKIFVGDVKGAAGVALDGTGNLYVSEPNGVMQLGIHGAVYFNDFAPVIPYVPANAEAEVFNIGNAPLTLTNFSFAGTNPEDFVMAAPNASPACDAIPATAPGGFCFIGMSLTAGAEGARSATLAISSNAANAAPVNVALSGTAVIDTRPGTTMTITTSPARLTYPADVTVTVAVAAVNGGSGTPVGTVTLTVTGQQKQSADLVNGVATFSFAKLNGGSYKMQGTYAGSGSDFGVSAGAGQFTVNPAASTVAWNPAPSAAPEWPYIGLGLSRTLTVKVSAAAGIPTGKVSFREGTTEVGQAQLDAAGTASFNTSSLDAGGLPNGTAHAHTITPVYLGDANFAAVTATPVTFNIVNPGVLVSSSPANLTVQGGTPGTVTLTLNSLVGYQKTVLLACNNLPSYAQCTFSNPRPTIALSPATTVTVMVSTNVAVNVANAKPAPRTPLWAFGGMFAVGLVGLVFGKKTKYDGRVLTVLCLALLITAAVAGTAACGNSGYSQTPPAPHVTTPAGSYAVTITATEAEAGSRAGVVSLPFTFNVTVQ